MKTKHDPLYYAAVVVINTDGKVLLGKRKEDGIWTTPAGGANPGEEDASKTASRELFEEAGIAVDPRFLQLVHMSIPPKKKMCYVYFYVVHPDVMVTSKLDPDQEVKTWQWFSMNEIPDALRKDERRFESVRLAYMKFYGVSKSVVQLLEKGGKPAQVGEIRTFGGSQYQKMGDGNWKPYVHPEEKKLEAEQNKNKVISLTDKLKEKVEQKKQVTSSEQHLSDLKSQAIVPDQQTRSEKPVFTRIDDALAHGYDAADFREVGNFFYDRAQKMADNIEKLKQTKQEVDPNYEKIKKINLQYAKSFIGQANHIDDRQAKSKASVKKSTVMMGHADAASINTADFAIENKLSAESSWLDRFYKEMDGYSYGDVPRQIVLDKGDLYLVKVEEGLYSGIFKQFSQNVQEQDTDSSNMVDNAKIRIERMTLPSLIQLCMAKDWIRLTKPEPLKEVQLVESLTAKLEAPLNPVPGEPGYTDHFSARVNQRIRFMELLDKLMN